MTMPNPGGNGNSPDFATPDNYPTRPTLDLIYAIAAPVVAGAHPKDAAMAVGVTPARLKRWMDWGREAVERDANPSDPHAMYLFLYLALSQASARAKSGAAQLLWLRDPAKWLAMNPESRGDWGTGDGASLIEPSNETADRVIQPPAEQSIRTREVLKMLIESGAAIAPTRSEGDQHDIAPSSTDHIGETGAA